MLLQVMKSSSPMPEYFDSHAHLDRFENVSEIIQNAHEAGLTNILHVAVDEPSLKKGIELQKNALVKIHLAAGTPPHDVTENFEDSFFPIVQAMAREKRLAAIGECGLEYFYSQNTKQFQKELFLRYAWLAHEENLPFVIHCREAFSDLFELLDELPNTLRGVLHCFTGTYEDAKNLVDRHFYISFSGIITYPKNGSLRDIVAKLPMDNILIETDSPYLPPQPYRGKKNEPRYLLEIAKAIAHIRNIPLSQVADATFKNASLVFQMGVA
jgi:TatD DNase family protein